MPSSPSFAQQALHVVDRLSCCATAGASGLAYYSQNHIFSHDDEDIKDAHDDDSSSFSMQVGPRTRNGGRCRVDSEDCRDDRSTAVCKGGYYYDEDDDDDISLNKFHLLANSEDPTVSTTSVESIGNDVDDDDEEDDLLLRRATYYLETEEALSHHVTTTSMIPQYSPTNKRQQQVIKDVELYDQPETELLFLTNRAAHLVWLDDHKDEMLFGSDFHCFADDDDDVVAIKKGMVGQQVISGRIPPPPSPFPFENESNNAAARDTAVDCKQRQAGEIAIFRQSGTSSSCTATREEEQIWQRKKQAMRTTSVIPTTQEEDDDDDDENAPPGLPSMYSWESTSTATTATMRTGSVYSQPLGTNLSCDLSRCDEEERGRSSDDLPKKMMKQVIPEMVESISISDDALWVLPNEDDPTQYESSSTHPGIETVYSFMSA